MFSLLATSLIHSSSVNLVNNKGGLKKILLYFISLFLLYSCKNITVETNKTNITLNIPSFIPLFGIIVSAIVVSLLSSP